MILTLALLRLQVLDSESRETRDRPLRGDPA